MSRSKKSTAAELKIRFQKIRSRTQFYGSMGHSRKTSFVDHKKEKNKKLCREDNIDE